jgi:hypothetical protein
LLWEGIFSGFGGLFVDFVKKIWVRRSSRRRRGLRLTHIISKYKHSFPLPPADDPGCPKDPKNQEEMDLAVAQSLIVHALGIGAAKMNISAREGCSPSMVEFIRRILDVGIRAGRQSKSVSAASLYQGISRWSLANEIRNAGDDFNAASKDSFRQVKFVSIAVDAGTVLGLHGVYAIMWNPYYVADRKPILIDLSTGEHFSADFYEDYFKKIVAIALSYDVSVCSIVVDNLAAQSKGLREFLENSNDSNIAPISHIPCFCHTISLAFTNSVTKCGHVAPLVESVLDWQKTLRDRFPASILEKRCPLIPRTRWLYLTDVLTFIVQHENDIKTIALIALNEGHDDMYAKFIDGVPVIFKDSLRILNPLRFLCDKFEANCSMMCRVVPLVREAIQMFSHVAKGLTKDDSKTIFRHIVSRFLARMATDAPEEAVTAYLLSPDGRDWFRIQEQGFTVTTPVTASVPRPIINPFLPKPKLSPADCGEMEEDLNESQFAEEEVDEAGTCDDYEDELLGRSIESILSFDPYENAYSRAVARFGHVAEKSGLESEVVDRLKTQFQTWLTDRTRLFLLGGN